MKLWSNFKALWSKTRGKVLIIGVILLCIGVYIYELPREMNMYDALLDGIEKHLGIEYEDIVWENVDFPLYSEDNKKWIESNKSPQAVEDAVRSKLEGFTVLEKGKTVSVSSVSDLWIHANADGRQFDVRVKIDKNGITVFYDGQIAIEYEIK